MLELPILTVHFLIYTEPDRQSNMISLHLSVLLSTLCGMRFLFNGSAQQQSSPSWFEIIETYDFCHNHIQVSSSGTCWLDGVQVDCLEAGMSLDTVALLRCVKPSIEILSLLAFFTCIITHVFYKAYDKRWCSPSELQNYRPWIMFSALLSVIGGVTSTAMSITLGIVTAYEEEGTCNHGLRPGWAVVLVILLTGVLVALAKGFAEGSAEMVYESVDTSSQPEPDAPNEEKMSLLLQTVDEKV